MASILAMYGSYSDYADLAALAGYGGGLSSLGGIGAAAIVALVLGIIGAIVAGILYIGKGKIGRYTGFQRWLSEHLNFNKYLLSGILKVLYAFLLVYCIVLGIGTMFTSFLAGLLTMVLGPVAARLVIELIMVLLSIREEVATTNQLLRGQRPDAPMGQPPMPPQGAMERPQPRAARQQMQPMQQQPMQQPMQPQPMQRRPAPPQSYPTMQEFTGQYAPVRPEDQPASPASYPPPRQEAPRARRTQQSYNDYNADV